MRKIRENQPPLTPIWPEHRLSDELRMISSILDDNPGIPELILHDLSDRRDPEKGSPSLSAEQVLRCALLKNWQGFSYERLAFHLSDSLSFAAFCRLPMGWAPSRSCLQENIGRIRAGTARAAAQAAARDEIRHHRRRARRRCTNIRNSRARLSSGGTTRTCSRSPAGRWSTRRGRWRTRTAAAIPLWRG